MLRLFPFVLYFLFMISLTTISHTIKAEESTASQFRSPEGIQFTSYSAEWDESRLKGLYEVLLRCEHGKELAMLQRVVLHPERSKGRSGHKVGLYKYQEREIHLYEVNAVPVERILIHEYGHHFTFYWLHKTEGVYPFELTPEHEWSMQRQLEGYPVRWKGHDGNVPYYRKWDPAEIMAEDYVLLFGGAARKVPSTGMDIIRMQRHENELIPSVQSLPGIIQYWEKAAGLEGRERLAVPQLEQVHVEQQEDQKELMVTFSAASPVETIQYAVELLVYPSEGSFPLKTMSTFTGQGGEVGQVRLQLSELGASIQSGSSFGQISIWAYAPGSSQFINTPYYSGWYTMELQHNKVKAIAPPWRKLGLLDLMHKEGMKQWPLLHYIVGGRELEQHRKYTDASGTLYIPLEAIMVAMGSQGEEYQFTTQEKRVTLYLNRQEAYVDGNWMKLSTGLQLIHGKPALTIADVSKLLNCSAVWDEEEGSLELTR
jgi:hypothetical protein